MKPHNRTNPHNHNYQKQQEKIMQAERQLWKELNHTGPTYWEQLKDLILVILLLIVFTSPLWMAALGITS